MTTEQNPGLTKEQLIKALEKHKCRAGYSHPMDTAIDLVRQLAEPALDARISRIRKALLLADGWEDGETFYQSTLDSIREILAEPASPSREDEREVKVFLKIRDCLEHYGCLSWMDESDEQGDFARETLEIFEEWQARAAIQAVEAPASPGEVKVQPTEKLIKFQSLLSKIECLGLDALVLGIADEDLRGHLQEVHSTIREILKCIGYSDAIKAVVEALAGATTPVEHAMNALAALQPAALEEASEVDVARVARALYSKNPATSNGKPMDWDYCALVFPERIYECTEDAEAAIAALQPSSTKEK